VARGLRTREKKKVSERAPLLLTLGIACRRVSAPILNYVVNLSSVLWWMLSEKKLVGFLKNYETPGKPTTAGEADNEAHTNDGWKNL